MEINIKPKNLIKRYFATGETKRRAWGRHFERRAAGKGVAIYKTHLNWTTPGPFRDAQQAWCGQPGIPEDRCYFLYAAAKAISATSIQGATADCGVRYGKSSHFILCGMSDSTRTHRIFDSFEGLSEPTKSDVDRMPAGTSRWHAGDLAVDEETVRRNLVQHSNCEFHKGWIPAVFDKLGKQKFALVHVDVDLYEPTMACFAYFYDLMTTGGMMICDDYGFASCSGATQAVDEFFKDKKEKPLPLPSGQCVVTKL